MIVTRSFIIAVRYSYISKFRMSKTCESVQYTEFISKDLLIPQWYEVNPKGLDDEVDAALWRN